MPSAATGRLGFAKAEPQKISFVSGSAMRTRQDGYSKLREDVQYRKEVAEQVGLVFELSAGRSDVVPNVPNSQPTKTVANAM